MRHGFIYISIMGPETNIYHMNMSVFQLYRMVPYQGYFTFGEIEWLNSTLLETKTTRERLPLQQESSLPTTIYQWLC